MKKMKLLTVILLIVALVGALALVNKNQEMRKGATFANTTLSILPSTKITGNVGDTVTAQLWFYTENDSAKVDGVQTEVCYGNELTLNQEKVVANTAAGFDESPIVSVTPGTEKSCAVVVATSKKTASSLSTTAKAVTLSFTAAKAGSGTITINKDKSAVTGDNTASATDKSLAVTSVIGTAYEITEVLTGDEPILNYKVSFGNVKVADGKCADKWPIQVIVLSNGDTKVYSNVVPQQVKETNSLIVYQGSLPLTGFTHLTDVAAFIKGPKHLQRKYATQNQDSSYDKAGGSLTLTKLASTSPVYDFTGYPMLAGDVVGATVDSGPNGEINGVDFAYVKEKVQTHKTITPEQYAGGERLQVDLDGNCQEGPNDLTVLKLSLEQKQGELY